MRQNWQQGNFRAGCGIVGSKGVAKFADEGMGKMVREAKAAKEKQSELHNDRGLSTAANDQAPDGSGKYFEMRMWEINQKTSLTSKRKKLVQRENEREQSWQCRMHARGRQQTGESARRKISLSREKGRYNWAAEKKPDDTAAQARSENFLEQREVIKAKEQAGDGTKKEKHDYRGARKKSAEIREQHRKPERQRAKLDSKNKKKDAWEVESRKIRFYWEYRETEPDIEEVKRYAREKTRPPLQIDRGAKYVVQAEPQEINRWAWRIET